MMQWNTDMDAAPRDGTVILAANGHTVYDAWWWERGDDTDTGNAGWVDGTKTAHGEEFVTYNPTHWMPLPEPPKGSE